MEPTASRYQSPGLLRRLAAILYDAFLLLSLLLVAVTLVVVPYVEFIGPEFPRDNWLYRLYLLLVAAGFYSFFWVRGGQTLGMRAWRFRLIRDDGRGLELRDALRRLFWATVTLGPVGLPWVLVDRERLSWYDRLSRTRPVMLKKRERPPRGSADSPQDPEGTQNE